MTKLDFDALEKAINSLPLRFRGPGGVAGVMKDGEVLFGQAWGYADLDRHVPMTVDTLMPICSISKQFTCALLLDLAGDPSILDDRLAPLLPNLQGARPTVAQLCHNQSGLRDYWALTVLHGALADGIFAREDTRRLFARMRDTHFAAGHHYSYSNGNFRLLSDLIEEHAGRPLGALLEERIFGPAGMETALLATDTSAPLNGVIGYEGNADVGFFPAANRIYWSGDAGIAASLDDMLAWERFIDATRDDESGLYNRISVPQAFADGSVARYGYGIQRETIGNTAVTGHGGALRGFRCRRLHAAFERLSVVVMFNHDADAHAAAQMLMKAALGVPEEKPAGARPGSGWEGRYIEPSTGLVLTVTAQEDHLTASFAGSPERLALGQDGIAISAATILERDGDAMRIERPGENLKSVAIRISGAPRGDIAGRFVSSELDASLEITEVGGAFYGAFEGFLGRGAMHPIYPTGEDVWLLSCRRSMDAPAPGDWTIQIRRDADDRVCGLVIGCWLARKVEYDLVRASCPDERAARKPA